MDRIAIIDDNPDMRGTLAGHVRIELDSRGLNWEVLEQAPFEDLNEYAPWLVRNEVRILVLDEKLSGSAEYPGVDYAGHDIATFVRKRLPDLPQFVVTAAKIDHDLNDAAIKLDDILTRSDFDENMSVYVERMLRMGKSYVDRYGAQLAEFSRIARAAAEGVATHKDLRLLEEIRASTHGAFAVEGITNAREWLAQAEEIRSKLEEAVCLLRGHRSEGGEAG